MNKIYASKQAILLSSVNPKNIVVSYTVKHNDGSYKYFTGYSHDDVIRSLCVILSQMSGYTKHFENGEKICHLKLKKRVCI